MGRRYGFSFSAINRVIAANRAAEKRRQNAEIIAANSGKRKELEPEYSIHDFDFNEQTRIAKVEFEKLVRYRTVERYIQQNYERYPIYSEWKIRTSSTQKSIKLTNANLETLNLHSDPLVRKFAFEIVSRLKNQDLFPSWFQKDCIEEEYKANDEEQRKHLSAERSSFKNLRVSSQMETEDNNEKLEPIRAKKQKIENKIGALERKIEKAKERKPNVLLSIITIGIYAYLKSNGRIARLEKKKSSFVDAKEDCEKSISDLEDKNKQIASSLNDAEKKFSDIKEKIAAARQKLHSEKETKIKEIEPLPVTYESDNSFILLKKMAGLEYRKIIGCYIIRNRLNNKCYVGQSKDIVKRIHQHFRGTYPNNMIFAEDYFAANDADKDTLFEVKIIPCTTKDELDKTERDLIEEYDAFSSGYNGTNGNT